MMFVVVGEWWVIWAMWEGLYVDCGDVRCLLCGWYVCVLIIAGGLWDAVMLFLSGWGESSSSCVVRGVLESISYGEIWLCSALCVWVSADGHLAPPAFVLQNLLPVVHLCVPRRASWSCDCEMFGRFSPGRVWVGVPPPPLGKRPIMVSGSLASWGSTGWCICSSDFLVRRYPQER